MKKFIYYFTLIFAIIIGCSDNSTGPTLQQTGTLKVYMVDSPSSLDSIIIFVKRVEVHKADSDSMSSWYNLNDSLR